MLDLTRYTLADLTDSVGAAKMIADRFGTNYTVEALRQLVKNNRIRCLTFQSGVLVERTPSELTRGRDLYFLRGDIEVLEKPKRGRRW